ncbi:hypothetical protein QR680_016439 [Steinernema hermaphroditum]|uniref:NTR domain-containing protein n=1 Tax=Steinernema hermaphroditum TaxID=289476 RepID=A0AA39HC82_9BILA|nr:hypothetical protein QR680_016439 [Steinernema hermaphroditum]
MHRFVLLSALLAVGFGCTCPNWPNTKGNYCDSDFVGLFTIGRKTIPEDQPGKIYYLTRVDRVFKDTKGFTKVFPTNLVVTNSQITACGLCWLESGKQYLLNGPVVNATVDFIDPRALEVSTCVELAPTQWSEVPVDIKKTLENGGFNCTSN